MADLTINVKVNTKDIDSLAASLKDKFSNMKFGFEDGSISSLKRELDSLRDMDDIDLKVNVTKAIADLGRIESDFISLKAKMEQGIDIKMNGKDMLSGFSASDFTKGVSRQLGTVDGLSQAINSQVQRDYQHVLENARKLESKWRNTDTHSKGEDYLLQKQQETLDNYNKLKNGQTEWATQHKSQLNNMSGDLKEYTRMAQEVQDLQTKIDSGTLMGNQTERAEERIRSLGNEMENLRAKVSKEFADMSSGVGGDKGFKNTADIFDNITKNISESSQEARNFAREIENTNQAISQMTKNENEAAKLMKQSEQKSVGEQENQYLRERAELLRRNNDEIRKTNAYDNASDMDKASLNNLQAINQETEKQTRLRREASQADAQIKADLKAQADAYKELEKVTNDYYKSQQKVDELQSKADTGDATTRQLEQLEAEKIAMESLRKTQESMYNDMKSKGQMSDEYEKSYQALQKMNDATTKIKNNQNDAMAQVRKTQSEYKEIEDSMKRQQQYSKQEASERAKGNNITADSYAELIASEKELQSAIRERINLEGRADSATEESLGKQAEANRRELEAHEKIANAQQRQARANQGGLANYKSMFGMDSVVATIDVMDVWREGVQQVRQAFNAFKDLDDALVDVRKVANATDSEWKGFTNTIYDNASAVGKSAEEYAKSVERWSAAGFELGEATELGRLSTMGAFVGNIGEEAMVKYMSVPLNAYKTAGLEAQDILNAMNEVANNNAVEMDHLGMAYSRAAATASQSGTSFAELTAIIGAAQEGTRLGGEVIGTTWRTMDRNVAQIASRSTKGQQDIFDSLKAVGVDVLDVNGNLMSTYDVLEQLQDAWGGLDDIQRSTLATNIGGARGLPIVQSLMANWDTVQKILGEAEGQIGLPMETGSMFDEFAEQQDSMSFKLAELSNNWLKFLETITGGSDTFKGLLDTANNFLEKMNEVVQNDSFMDWFEPIVTGLGVLLGSDLLLTLGSKLFGGGGIASFFRDLTVGAGDAGKALEAAGKSSGAFMRVFSAGGWQALPIKLMAAYAAFQLLDFAIEKVTGKDIGGWVRSWSNPLNDSIDDFSESVTRANETISRNNEIIADIDSYREVAQAYRDMQAERRAAYLATGDATKLSMPEQEFSKIQQAHNELVEQLGLPLDLRIEFNGYDHVNQQLDALEGRIRRVRAEMIAENIGAMESAYSSYADVWEKASEITSGEGTDRAESRKIWRMSNKEQEAYRDSLNVSMEDWQVLSNGAEEYGRSIDKIREAFGAPEYQEAYKQLKNIDAEFDKLVRGAMDGPNPLDDMRRMFENPEYQFAQPMAFMKAFQGVMKEQGRIAELSEGVTSMGELLDKAFESGDGVDRADAINSAQTMISALEDTVAMQQFLQDSLEDGVTMGEVIQAAFEGDEDALATVNKFRDVALEAVQEISDGFMESKTALTGFADAMGMTGKEVEGLMQAYDEGRMGDIAKAFFDTNSAMASLAYGLDTEAQIGLAQMSFDKFGNIDQVGDIIKGITDQINTLPDEVITSFQLVDESGNMDYNRIIADLEKYDGTKFLAQIGVQMEDGTYDNVGNLYLAMEEFDSLTHAQSKEVSTKFNIETNADGLITAQDIIDNIESGNIRVDVEVDEEGNLTKLELAKTYDGETYTVDLLADGETSPEAEKIMGMSEEKKIVDVKIVPEYHVEDELSEGHIQSLFNLASETVETVVDVETGVNHILNEDGTADVGKLADVINAKMESQEFVTKINSKLDLELETGDSFNLSDLSDALHEKFPLEHEQQLALLLEILPEFFGIDTTEQELTDELEGMEATAEPTVGVEPELEGGEELQGLTQDYVDQSISAGNIEPVTAVVDIAIEENIIQDNLSGIADILGEDYGIDIDINVEDGGLEQVSSALRDLPPEQQIMVLAEAMGLENISELESIIEGIPSEKVVQAILHATGAESLEEGLAILNEFDKGDVTVQALTEYATSGEPPEEIEDTESEHITHFVIENPQALIDLDGEDISFTVIANVEDNASSVLNDINSTMKELSGDTTITISLSSDAVSQISEITSSLQALGGEGGISINITANATVALLTIAAVNLSLNALNAKVVTPKINGDNSGYIAAANRVRTDVIPDKMVRIDGDASAYHAVVASLGSKTITMTINAKVNRSSSMAIGDGIATAFSSSIGDMAVPNRTRSAQINRNYSTGSEEATVNEDVWRYWAKELFDGEELSNSMDELSAALRKAEGNYSKMISLYQQQISLTREQMRYEKEMVALQQQEMNDILSELRAIGFRNEGNRITNLDFAKGLSGDSASEADTLLSDWRGLYESINGLNANLANLSADIFGLEQDIEQARIDMELERIEKRLRTSEFLLNNLNNHLDILNTKDSLVGDLDYELKLMVSEENVNQSVSNINRLVKEFDALTKVSYQYEEAGEEIHAMLEDLADEIIDNADNIIKYREAINQIKLDAIIEDFDRFSNAIANNADSVSRNVDNLRAGLVSGLGIGELGPIFDLDFTRKTEIERHHEERLRLEARLDKALEQYAKQNIERNRRASNAIIDIAQQTNQSLMEIQTGFSGGFYITGSQSSDLGILSPSNNKYFDQYQARMLEFIEAYQRGYSATIATYDRAMRKASTASEKQQAYNDMILAQLKLQEGYQYRAIDMYERAIELANEQLQNEELTTEQRRELLDMIDEYKENIVDAQDTIRDAIAERYDYEFEMLDKAMDKAKTYADSVQHLLDVGQLVNLRPNDLAPFFEALYGASIHQYQLAKEQLRELNAEQAKFESGSFEWNLLGEKIEEVSEAVKELGISALEANAAILENTMDALETEFQQGFLDGKTLDQWKEYYDNWVDGIDKELRLEELRVKAINAENDLIDDRLEMLDRQEEVSAKDLEYLDKQLDILELQNKLRNIEGERNVQTLMRREDGTFAFEYVADQTEYEDTQKEIREAERELAEFRREQREGYVSSLGDIIGRAREGQYDSPEDLQQDLATLNRIYGYVLEDLPGFEFLDLDGIVQAYRDYMATNDLLATDLVGDGAIDNTVLQHQSAVFAQSFLDISSDLGNIIGSELRNALGLVDGQSFINPTHIYQIGEVILPNVTDGEGLAEIFNSLPQASEQQALNKYVRH